MSSVDQLALLDVARRNALEALLMEFDQNWTQKRLIEFRDRVESELEEDLHRVALAELLMSGCTTGPASCPYLSSGTSLKYIGL